MHYLQVTAFSLMLTASCFAQDFGTRDPLFRHDSILNVTLEAPLTTLLRERMTDRQHPAKIRYTNDDGSMEEVAVRVRARGKFRRDPSNCRFPPIRLRFRGADVGDTIFEGLRQLPLVTHCQNSNVYEQGVLREYMAYRILQEITELSLDVRLFRITYIDTEGKQRDHETFAVAIEHRNRLAARSGTPLLEIPRTKVAYLDSGYLNLTSLFQFLIGNTDFSPIQAAEGENCCHNHRLFGVEAKKPPQYPVPYDFDMTGIVSLPHSQPHPSFKLRDVRQRRYRGRCVNNQHIPASIAVFTEKRDSILGLVESLPGASRATRKALRSYIDGFYSVIDNPRKVQREIIDRCV